MSNPNLRLLDTVTAQVLPYPRWDDEPVDGLDPRYQVLTVVRDPEPAHDPETQRLEETQTVDAAAGELRITWTVVDLPVVLPEPQYEDFYNGFLSSNLYQALLIPALAQPGSDVLGNFMTIVAIALQDSMAGRVPLPAEGSPPNSLQSAIWLLMSVMGPLLSAENLAELQGLLVAHNLALYYSLTPPGGGS